MEYVRLLSFEPFAFLSKAKAAEISQFELELFDDEAVMLEALFEAIQIRLNASGQGLPNGRIKIQCFQQGQGFHGDGLYRINSVIPMIS